MSADLTEMVAFLREHTDRDAQTAYDQNKALGMMVSGFADSVSSICDEAVRAKGDERKLWAHAVSLLVSAYWNHEGFRMDWAPGNSEHHRERLAKIRESGITPAEHAAQAWARKSPRSDRTLTLSQAAEIMGMSEQTVRRYIQQGLLPGHRLGPRVLRVMESDLDALLTPLEAANE